jgi:very-short-patch-repair endonuclease
MTKQEKREGIRLARQKRLLAHRTWHERQFAERLTLAGIHFEEQVIIGCYYADFLIDGKLVVELDGSQHAKQKAQRYDERRDAYMRQRGFRVIRIPNAMVNSFKLERLFVSPGPQKKKKRRHKRKAKVRVVWDDRPRRVSGWRAVVEEHGGDEAAATAALAKARAQTPKLVKAADAA